MKLEIKPNRLKLLFVIVFLLPFNIGKNKAGCSLDRPYGCPAYDVETDLQRVATQVINDRNP